MDLFVAPVPECSKVYDHTGHGLRSAPVREFIDVLTPNPRIDGELSIALGVHQVNGSSIDYFHADRSDLDVTQKPAGHG